MPLRPRWAAVASAAVLVLGLAGCAEADISTDTTTTSGGTAGLVCAADPNATTIAGFEGEDLDNAAVIVGVGKQLHVPERGWVIAVATSMQEAKLKNLDYGDTMSNGQMSSSRGLFQQLKTYGPDRTIPATAASMFYNGGPGGIPGLLQVSGWQSMTLAQAAEAVQHSTLPDAYTQWEQPANEVVGSVEKRTCSPQTASPSSGGMAAPPTDSAVATKVLQRALSQVGVPYSWGGGNATGPTLGICGPDGAENDCNIVGYDCSGLALYAYAGAGITVPHLTTSIWSTFPHITGRENYQAGDLLLISSDGAADGIHHVVIFMGGDQVVEAPYSGQNVQVTNDFWNTGNGSHVIGAVRPGGPTTAAGSFE